MKKIFQADAEERLDLFLARQLEGASRGYAQRLIERGAVTVGGKVCPRSHRLVPGEEVALVMPEAPEGPQVRILHEEKGLLLIEKPSGLVVHPAGETWLRNPEAALSEAEPSLVTWILRNRPPAKGLERCGIVHRLDKETSGVLAIAKTPAVQKDLLAQFKERRVEKVYAAVVAGRVAHERGAIEAPVGRVQRKLVASPWGKQAKSSFTVIEQGADTSLVEVRPLTGRTHQIRVHLSLIGHPVLGDREHGGPPAARLMLHARRLKVHVGKRAVEAQADVPKEFFERVRQKAAPPKAPARPRSTPKPKA